MAPKVLDKEEKRAQIALAAVEVFGNKGFDRTRIEDVAKAAGVGKGTIYEYFKNKKELMDGALEVLMSHMADGLMPPTDSGKSPLEVLKEMTRKTVEAIRHVADAYRFFLEYMLIASRSGEDYGGFKDILIDYRASLTNLIEAGIESGEIRSDVDAKGAAAAFAAWFDGAIFHWIVLPEDGSLEAMGESYLDMIIRGLEAKDETRNNRSAS
jgi:AcrR family transcriptional regulator